MGEISLLKAKASRDFAFVGAVEIWRLRFVGRQEIMAEGAGHSLGVIQSTLDNELPCLQRGVELNGVDVVRPIADLHSARDDAHLSGCPPQAPRWRRSADVR